MKKYKGRLKNLLLILAVIGVLLSFVAFKTPIQIFLHNASNGRLFDEVPSTDLVKLYFTGYEGTNIIADKDESTGNCVFWEDENLYTCDTEIFSDDTELELNYVKAYSGAVVTIDGTSDYPDVCATGTCKITLTVTAPGTGLDPTYFEISYEKNLKIDEVKTKPIYWYGKTGYEGDPEFEVPRSGTYVIEAWGGPGGSGCQLTSVGAKTCSSTIYPGGYGAYTKGTITLAGGTMLYINVGGAGGDVPENDNTTWSGGTPGGGLGMRSTGLYASGSGGGATDIRLIKETEANKTASLASRIMVAGGGGGGSYNETTANWSTHGGGLDVGGLTDKSTSCVANQSSGYAFGYAYNDIQYATQASIGIGGGGGGWYGGSGFVQSQQSYQGGPGCGGTSYISGHTGSIGVDENGNAKKNTLISEDITDSYSNTGYVFTDTVMIDGYNHQWTTVPSEETVPMPSSDQLKSSNNYGQVGWGSVRITQIAKYVKIDNVLSDLNYSDGELVPAFSPDVNNYELTLDPFTRTVDIEGIVADSATTKVTEAATYTLGLGEQKVVFVLTTDKTSGAVNTYKITIVRLAIPAGTHSTLIERIDNPNNDTIYMSKDVTTYDLPIRYGKMTVDLTVHLYDSDASYEIKGADFLLANTGVITIEVTDPLATPNKTVYTFNYTRETSVADVEEEYIYYYTGDYQTFITPITGDYKIEAWGAQGGTMQSGWTGQGGKGGYTSGEISLIQETPLYIYVGGKGVGYYCCGYYLKAGGWNGGGDNYSGASGGGGATDIRLVSGTWNNYKSLASRIMVAGGGGGSNDYQNGGYGGGLTGGTGVNGSSTNGTGGTQLSGGLGNVEGTRGTGGGAPSSNTIDGGSGGGGYWGGGKASGSNVAGGGGSSYISGYQGSIAVTSESATLPRVDSNGETCTQAKALDDVVCSHHYSGYIFRDTVMAAGNESQPTLDGKGVQTGNADAGYVKITPLSTKSENNFLENITFDVGKRDPAAFSPTEYEYVITVGIYTQFIELEGIAYDPAAIVVGDGKKLLEIGENNYTITVTAENGNIRSYNVTVIREGLKGTHSNMINNINIKDVGYIYPESGKYEYDFKLPYNKYEVLMDIKLYDEDATYEVTGADLVVANSGTVSIRVYHEDGKVPDVNYKLHYVRQLPLYDVEGTYVYNCVKYEEEFVAPLDGDYYIETWGAAGGGATSDYYSPSHGGRGGYTHGTIRLEQGESLYVRVGCQGVYAYSLNQGGGWNGGGHGGGGGYGGGGATDIRYNGNTLAKRIMVAGGGGGADNGGGSYGGGDDGSGGVGGGLAGENAKINGSFQLNTAGTQTFGYKQGNGASATTNTDTGGAGGGYYGGLVTNNYNGGAGGGSGYIDTELFPDGETVAGNTSFLGVDGENHEFGHPGDGNAKITVLSYLSENYYLENITTDIGTWVSAYEPAVKDYEVHVGTYDAYVALEAVAFDSYAKIKIKAPLGEAKDGKYELDMGDNIFTITVTAQNGATRIYTVNVVRQYTLTGHTAELQKIKFEGLGSIVCEPGVTEYEFEIPDTWYYLDVTPLPYDPASKQTVKGFSYIPQTQTATIISRVTGAKTLTYKIKIIKGNAETIFTYDYECTGDYQTFTAPLKGYYIFQLWGAQGGTRTGRGGRGGYATGMLMMEKDQTVYVYVGCSGNSGGTAGGWNGGGSRDNYAGGGGASDIRTEIDDLYTRFIVAGGGGSVGAPSRPGGDGGGTNGESRYQAYGAGGGGATQTAGGYGSRENTGTFGIGGHGYSGYGGHAGAGGGGWYGGGGSTPDGSADDDRGGGGGSGFVLTAATIANTPAEYKLDEDYYLKDTKLIEGYNEMPNPDSNGTMVGRYGNGFVRIKLATLNDNNFLSKIVIKHNDQKLEYSPTFNIERTEYTVNLEPNQTTVTIEARPDDSTATMTGLGEHEIPPGSTRKEIKVTSESGKERSYYITFNREAGTSSVPTDIKISGLIDKYCSKDEEYCVLSPSEFDDEEYSYTMTVPYQISQLNFEVIKTNENQVVTGSGTVTLKDATTNVAINVQSEACALAGDLVSPGCLVTYQYSITRNFASDADIKSLRIVAPEKELLFDRDVIEYTISVPYEYTSVELDYVLDSADATATVTGNEDFKLGWNRVEIEVKALDGTKKKYGLNIYREKSTSTFLTGIYLSSGTGDDKVNYILNPPFNKLDLGMYEFNVPNAINELDLLGIVEATGLSSVEYSTDSSIAKIDKDSGHITDLPTGISIFYLKVTAQDETFDTYKVRIVRAKDNNSLLESLVVKIGDTAVGLGTTFNPNTLSYIFTVPVGTRKLDIFPVAQSPTATVTISTTDLVAGDNIIKITVTAEDGTQTVYTLTVTRPPSTNNILDSLTVEKYDDGDTTELVYSPVFDTSTFEYEIDVPNDVKQVKISGTIADPLATINNNGGIYAVAVGTNKILFTVTSESGTEREYTIIINRAPSSNAFLQSITISDGQTITMTDHAILTYTFNIANSVENITFESIVPEESTTTWEITKEPADSPLSTKVPNVYEITTLAEDGTTSKVYTINVIRDKSDNTNLSWLLLKEGIISPKFSPTTLNYTAKVPYDVTKGTLQIETESDAATVSVTNNINSLDVGENIITITVTAEIPEYYKEYTITIIRQTEEATSNKLYSLYVDPGTLVPAFDKDVPYYEVEVPHEVTKITVSGDPIDMSEAKVEGMGTYSLQVGRNVIGIRVFSSDNKERDYQIVVRRKPSTEARLKSLVLDGAILTPAFNPDVYYYETNTQDAYLTFMQITTMQEDATYKILDNYFASPSGTYTVTILVTAQDKVTQKEYTIQVTKEPSRNAYLQYLEVEGYSLSPGFSPGTSVYQVTVPAGVLSVNVIAESKHPGSTIDGTGIRALSSGVTNLIVRVTSEAGDIFDYTIVVRRPASNDARIKDLILYNGTFYSPDHFDPDVFNYIVEVPYDVDYLDYAYVLMSNTAKVSKTIIKVTYDFFDTAYWIYVTAEDGTTCVYYIKLQHAKLVSALLSNLEVKDYLLDPTFNRNVFDYYIYQNNEDESIEFDKIVPLDIDASYSITAPGLTVSGKTISGMDVDDKIYDITISVTDSEGKETKDYVIHVYHQPYVDNFLNYIYYYLPEVGTEIYYPEPTFDKYTLTYTVSVPNNITQIDLEAAYPSDLTVSGTGTHSLPTGTTTLPITVVKGGVKRQYLVKVTRAYNSNNNIKNISLVYDGIQYADKLVPVFDEDTQNYTLTVEYGTKYLDVDVTLYEGATASGIGQIETPIGTTSIPITVTAEDGTTKVYTIVVTRNASSDNTLIELIPSAGELDPDFTVSEDTYTLNVPSGVGTLSFTARTTDGTATITGLDSDIVPDGDSVREIVVTAEDLTSKKYTINIHKYSPDDAYLRSLQIGDIVFDPVFVKTTYIYKVVVPNSMKTIGPSDVSAVPEDLSATVTKQSSTNLSTTVETDYAILVTAADGATKKTYHLQIIRELGAAHTLASLSTTTGYIAEKFASTKYEYTYYIPTTQTEVDESYFKYTLTDENSTVQFIPESIDLTVTDLPTTMTIKVMSEDLMGYTDYTITLKWDFNSVNTLASLSVEYGYMVQKFKAGLYTYDVYEYYDTTFDVVTATAQSEKATIKPEGIGTINFEGKTDFYHYVTVVAEDGSELQYTIHFIVDRLRDEHLTTLAIEGVESFITQDDLYAIDEDDTSELDKYKLKPAFDPDVVEYEISVPYNYILLDWYFLLANDQQRAVTKVNGEETADRTYKLPVNNKRNPDPTVLTIEVYDGMNTLTRIYTINITRLDSSNARLDSLKITSMDGTITYPLEPDFNTNNYEYQINVENDVNEVHMVAKTSDPNAIAKYNGYNNLIGGEDNLASVTVTAPDGTIKVYYIHIIKPSVYNSWLKQITVSTGEFHELTPTFRKTTKYYTLKLSGEIDEVYIDAIPDVPTTIVRGTGRYTIGLGMNVIKLTSTATNGSVTVYEIGIIQEAEDGTDLKSLVMDGYDLDPKFDKSIIHYEVDVDETTTNVNITAIPVNPKSTVYITGDKDLMTGENTISIQVLSQSKASSKTYQIIARRPVSSNSYLNDLYVYNIVDDEEVRYTVTPTFVSDDETAHYEVTVPYNVTGVFVGFTKAVPTSKVSGAGYQALDYGDKEVEITVTAEDGTTTRTYPITIHRQYNHLLEKIELSNSLKLDQTFNPEQKEYTVTVPNNIKRVYVKGTPQDPVNVEVVGNSTYPSATGVLTPGQYTTATLVLQSPAPDSTVLNTYTVKFMRQKNSETQASMISIAEGSLSPKFNPETKKYEAHVHAGVATAGHVTFTVTPKASTTEWAAIGNSGLVRGKNEVKIRMTAEDESTEDYDFDIYVEDDEYFSNQLTSLTVTYPGHDDYAIALSPNFDPEKNMYTASVAYSVDVVSINAVAGVHALITGDTEEQNIDYGNNIFEVTVTNTADDSIPANTYTILIQRSEDNANLAELVVKGHTFVFAQATKEYTIDITDEELSLDITAVPVDPNATVDIFGNGGFVIGTNTITIKVTTPTNKTEEYKIYARLAVSNNPYLKTLTIDGYTYYPAFDSTTSQTYTLTVDTAVNSVLFTGVPVKSGTTCTNLGSVDLDFGVNNISIVCTASDNTTTHSYDFVITRLASSNNKLMSLTVSPGSLNETFDEDITDYTVTLGKNDGQMIRINANPKDDDSTVEGTGEYYLSEKTTTIPIVVTAADGSKRTYNVTVTIYIDTTPTLADLWVEEGQISPSFNKNITTYSLHVPNEITDVHVKYKAANDTAQVHITGDTDLEVSKTNEVVVQVHSPETGENNEYTIYVIRDPYASNLLSKITVQGSDNVYYDLNPAFAGDHLYYEVTVPYNVTKAKVNGKTEDSTATLTGAKNYSLNVGTNTAYLFVISASNYTRTYTIVITRQSEDETPNASYLTSLTEDVADADLSPTFNSAVTEYSITVSSDTGTITLGGTAAPGATVKGFGKSVLKYGTNRRTITVTGSDSSETKYYVTITRPYTDKTAVTKITPSVGVLNYVDGVTEYDMDVEATVAAISFDVEPADPLATVEGNEETTLASGRNLITITITGTNGEERKIHIYINKSTAVTDIELEKHTIIVGVGESVSVNYEFDPIDTSYTDVTWSVDNPDYVDLAVNGLITGKSPGSATVTITSDFDSNVSDSVIVKVIYKEITLKPDTYDIGTATVDPQELKYVYKTEPGTKINEYMKKFKNETEYLHIYKPNGEEIDPTSTDRLATGMYLELIVDDKVIDSATVIVMGDTGDTYVTGVDLNALKKGVQNVNNLSDWYLQYAFDLNYDGNLTGVDINLLKIMVKEGK